MPLSFLSYWPFSPSSSSTFFFSCFTSWSRSCTQNQDATQQPITSKWNVFFSFSFKAANSHASDFQLIWKTKKKWEKPKAQPYTESTRKGTGRPEYISAVINVLRGLDWAVVNIIGSVILPWNRHHTMQLSTTRGRMNLRALNEASRCPSWKFYRVLRGYIFFFSFFVSAPYQYESRKMTHPPDQCRRKQTNYVSTGDKSGPCKHTPSITSTCSWFSQDTRYNWALFFFPPKCFKHLRSQTTWDPSCF